MLTKLRSWGDEFKKFAVRGNVIDMAVGIIIGAAFSKIVNSLVSDVLMPPFGWLMGKVDFANLYLTLPVEGEIVKYPSLEAAKAAGAVTINYGLFINACISFLLVAFAVFLLIKFINKLQASVKKEEVAEVAETTKACPFCYSTVDIRATRCPNCTSELQ